MNSYKRAFFYVARKKGKSLTLFLLLLLVTVSVMTGISIRNGTEKAAKKFERNNRGIFYYERQYRQSEI